MASNLTVTSLLTFDADMNKGTGRSCTAIISVKSLQISLPLKEILGRPFLSLKAFGPELGLCLCVGTTVLCNEQKGEW